MMASSSTQHGRVLKVRIRDNKVMGKSEVLSEVHHGNGMTYDSKRNRLVVVGYGKWRHKLTYIDPDTLTVKPPEGKTQKQPSVKYSYVDDMKGVPNGAENNGIAAIAYVSKYDVYVARSRGRNSSYAGTTGSANNNLWVFDAETLEAIGHIYTKVTSKYPATYQSMDADEKYVYFLLSPGSGQKKNIILALDWNSEQLLPVVNRKEETDPAFVDTMWKCGTDGSPDAVVTIPISHESEGLFHTTDADGNEHFYVSEYYGRWKYKTVTKKKKYKVKWKKVKKKVKVKGKTKYKKVWKYKTKYKKVKVRKKVKWMRDDYVYDLGVI
jgi:hypothetical protein